MPQRSRLELPPLKLGKETVGERLARIRKERGYTQVELAERIGIIQSLVSQYEHDRLGLRADMLTRFAIALDVSADEILGLKASPRKEKPPARRILHRMARIQELPTEHQRALLKTIDAFLGTAGK